MKIFVSLCAATIFGVGGISTAPIASAWTVEGSGCVRSGQTVDHCTGMFIETLRTMFPPEKFGCDVEPCQSEAIHAGLVTIDSMMRSFAPNSNSLPPDKMFWDCVRVVNEANPQLADWQAEGFVRAAIHWFGPPGMEEAVNQIVPGR